MRYRTVVEFAAAPITTVTTVGPWVDASNITRAAAIVTLSGGIGSSAGSLTLQVSDHIPGGATLTAGVPPTVAINAAPSGIATAATTAVTGNGTYQLLPTEMCCRWVRVLYTASGGLGAGVLDGNLNLIGWP